MKRAGNYRERNRVAIGMSPASDSGWRSREYSFAEHQYLGSSGSASRLRAPLASTPLARIAFPHGRRHRTDPGIISSVIPSAPGRGAPTSPAGSLLCRAEALLRAAAGYLGRPD